MQEVVYEAMIFLRFSQAKKTLLWILISTLPITKVVRQLPNQTVWSFHVFLCHLRSNPGKHIKIALVKTPQTQFMGLVSAYFPVPKKSTNKSMVITVFTKKKQNLYSYIQDGQTHPSSHGPFRHGKLRTWWVPTHASKRGKVQPRGSGPKGWFFFSPQT